MLARLGLRLASWSARGFDTRVGDAVRVKNSLTHGLRAGAILLLHDGHAARTAQGIPVILEVLPALLESAAAAGLRELPCARPFHDHPVFAARKCPPNRFDSFVAK